MSTTETRITQYGFDFGPATVTRICSDNKLGVWLEVSGRRQRLEVRVTASGLLRVGPVVTRKEPKQ